MVAAQAAAPRDYLFASRDRYDESYDMVRAARDKRFKLYDKGDYPRAGKLYDVHADPLENSPIEPGRHSDVRKRLRAVLNSIK